MNNGTYWGDIIKKRLIIAVHGNNQQILTPITIIKSLKW